MCHVCKRKPKKRGREDNVQLRINQPTGKPPLHNPHHQFLQPDQEISRVARRRVSPVAIRGDYILWGLDVHPSELGADDRRARGVLCAGIERDRSGGDGVDEHGAVAVILGAKNAVFEIGAGGRQLGRVAVIVVRGQVRLDMFPTTVVVNRAAGIEGSVFIMISMWLMLLA